VGSPYFADGPDAHFDRNMNPLGKIPPDDFLLRCLQASDALQSRCSIELASRSNSTVEKQQSHAAKVACRQFSLP